MLDAGTRLVTGRAAGTLSRSDPMDDGDQAGVVRVAVHLVAYDDPVRLLRCAAAQPTQERLGEREETGDGGERVAGQPDEIRATGRQPSQQHRVAGAYGDAVDQQPGTDLGQDRVDMIDRTRRSAPGGDDKVRLGGGEGVLKRLRVVAETARGGDLGAQGPQPGSDHGAQSVPDQPVVRQTRGEQLVP